MITLVRHAQSTANAGGATMAHAEIPLSELGRRQAVILAELLDVEPDLILSSTWSGGSRDWLRSVFQTRRAES